MALSADSEENAEQKKASTQAKSSLPFDDINAFELEKWPFYMIVKTSSMYIKALEAELKGGDLDIPSWRALMLLGTEEAVSISHLAKEGVTKLSTMTRIVYRMRDQGLVDMRPRATDARVTEVLLTKKGTYARKVAWMHAQSVARNVLRDVPEDDLSVTITTLSKMFDNLEVLAP